MFIPKTLVNAFRRVTLLARQRLVFLKILLEKRKERSGFRLGHGASVIDGNFIVVNLLNRPKVQTKTTGGFSLGNVLDKKRVSNGGPEFHIFVHWVTVVISWERENSGKYPKNILQNH